MLDGRSLLIGRIIENFTLRPYPYNCYEFLRGFISEQCAMMKCKDLTDNEWQFVMEYCQALDKKINDMKIRRYWLWKA
ncbi:MAG: hypothetical protein QXU32_06645 [Nitrososphaerales archaeon]